MTFDIAMPLTLFAVTLVSLFLNQKAEGKLKTTFEERELRVRDALLLVVMMVVMVSAIVLFREMVAPLMVMFLFSYSMLLFIFTFIFSNNRWYLAAVPPATFVLLYVFFRDTALWSGYLTSVYGVVFAVLITIYIGSLFAWKSTFIFVVLLTVVDVILVLVTGAMVEAADITRGLNLPVVVMVPIIPLIATESGGLGMMALGLGDFFFAGLLAIQSFKKYGKRFAILSVIAMAVSFFVFEAFILTFRFGPFPGTLMIISGWLPLVLLKNLE